MNEGNNNINESSEAEDVLEYEEEGEIAKDTLKKLREKLKTCEKERQEYLEGWQRTKADFINAGREEEKSRAEFVQFAKEDVLTQVLPVVDSFELAFQDKEAWERIDENWRRGVEHIYTQLLQILKDNGLTPVAPLDAAFDATVHEAVETVEVLNKEDNGKVIEVVQKGYVLNGKVVRPSRVKVAEFKER